MGGSDEKDNLVKLSVEEHALAHKELFEEYGKYEDYIAWKSLTSQIGKEEIFLETSRIGGLNNKGKPKSEEHRRKISEAIKMFNRREGVKVLKERTKEKISASMLKNTNSKNHSSIEYKKTQSDAMKKSWERRRALNAKSVP